MSPQVLWGRPGPDSPVDVHEVDVPLPELDERLAGLRVALVSDLHYGRYVWRGFLRRVVDLTNAQRPDLILLPGDLVNHLSGHTDACAAELARLRAPCGVLASLGNHDHYAGARAVRQAVQQAGIDVLVNAHRVLSARGATLVVAGVDDWRRGRPDVAAALAGTDRRLPVILMSHNPDQAEHLPDGARVDLMVSGHTHGGQICPLGRAIVLRVRHRRYARGLVRGPRCQVYTSRGVGMVGLPLRLDCPPEVPILCLRPGG